MEKCPVCRRMTYEYDYTRQDWVCVSYECGAEGRQNGSASRGSAHPEGRETRAKGSEDRIFKV